MVLKWRGKRCASLKMKATLGLGERQNGILLQILSTYGIFYWRKILDFLWKELCGLCGTDFNPVKGCFDQRVEWLLQNMNSKFFAATIQYSQTYFSSSCLLYMKGEEQ